MIYTLDTHPLVWFLEGKPNLSKKAFSAIVDPSSKIVLPSIVLVEIAYLYAKSRTAVNVDSVWRDFISSRNCIVYPLDEQVLSMIEVSLNIHDSIIVATALVYRDILKEPTKLITKDQEIVDSGLIETLW